MALIHYNNCPVCSSNDLRVVFSVRDHTVSRESFPIIHCNSCTLRFTQDVPDAQSIGPYYKSEDYISHTDSSKGIINRLYRWVRKRTLKNKRRLIERFTGVKNGQLLDVGSGTGAFVNEMNDHGWTVTGLEPDEGARQVAKKNYQIDLKNVDEFYHLFGNFDAITLWHVLEHVHDLHSYIDQLKKLLKDKGCIFIAVPNYTSRDADIYKEYWAAYDVPRHLYHFSPYSMKTLMEHHGLKIKKHKPMWYDSFYISMLSSKYKNAPLNDEVGQGKTNLIASFLNGLRSNMNASGNVERCSSVIYVITK